MKNDRTNQGDAGTDASKSPAAPPVAKSAFSLQSSREKKILGTGAGGGGLVVLILTLIFSSMSGTTTDDPDQKPSGEEVVANNDQTDETPVVKTEEAKPEAPAETVVPTIVDSQPTEEPEPASPAAPAVLVTIELNGSYAKLASYKVEGADVAETIPVIAKAGNDVEHAISSKTEDGDAVVIILKRASKPEQAIVRIVVTDQTIDVGFQKEPTEDEVKAAQGALVALQEKLMIETDGNLSGTGTTRTVALVKK